MYNWKTIDQICFIFLHKGRGVYTCDLVFLNEGLGSDLNRKYGAFCDILAIPVGESFCAL